MGSRSLPIAAAFLTESPCIFFLIPQRVSYCCTIKTIIFVFILYFCAFETIALERFRITANGRSDHVYPSFAARFFQFLSKIE